MSYLLDFYGNVLTEKQRDMMQQYFNMDLSLSEIADNFNITRQGVRDAVKRGETVLTELEEQIGFAGKYREIIEDAEKIKAQVVADAERLAAIEKESAEIDDKLK